MQVKKYEEVSNTTQKRMLEKQEERIALLVAEAKKKEESKLKSNKPMEGKANGKQSSKRK